MHAILAIRGQLRGYGREFDLDSVALPVIRYGVSCLPLCGVLLREPDLERQPLARRVSEASILAAGVAEPLNDLHCAPRVIRVSDDPACQSPVLGLIGREPGVGYHAQAIINGVIELLAIYRHQQGSPKLHVPHDWWVGVDELRVERHRLSESVTQ